MTPLHLSKGFRERVERRLVAGYERDGLSIPSLVGPINWLSHHRSFSLRLNAWDPISELLMSYSMYREDRHFEVARSFAFDWITQFQFASFAVGPDPLKLEAVFGPLVWYDMAVGQRAYRLAYITDVMARDDRFEDHEVALGIASLVFHSELLGREDFFKAEHNHGFYQVYGELAAARRFRDEPFFAERFAMATDRALSAVDQQFFPGGLHREHSPGYHHMVMGSLIGARASGLIDSEAISKRVAMIEAALTWLIQPNGSLLTFGDTDPRNMLEGEFHADRLTDPALRYQLSHGALGEPPASGLKLMNHEGYAFVRSTAPRSPDDPWWYLAQIASFHSRVHKHADDLSFVWSDLGAEILIDPGRYAYGEKTEPSSDLAQQGFWYTDPKRIYVESTRAHNTVEIDGRSFNRKRKPYGSALTYAGEQNGLIVTECDLRHPKSARHWRVLVMNPGHFLLVVDWLFDRAEQVHDFRQHLHFHPAWDISRDLALDKRGQLLAHAERPDLSLTVLPLVPNQGTVTAIRGQETPELLGWYSDNPYSLVPCTSLISDRLQTDYAVFATLLTFGRQAEAAPKKTTVRKSMRPSVFAWQEANQLMQIEIQRGQDGSPVIVDWRH